jgi:hypothetical protein
VQEAGQIVSDPSRDVILVYQVQARDSAHAAMSQIVKRVCSFCRQLAKVDHAASQCDGLASLQIPEDFT